LHALFLNLLQAVPGLSNIAFLLMVFLYVLTVLGMDLFGRFQYTTEATINGFALSEHAHFGSFFVAIFTLFRVATNDSWTILMYSVGNPIACDSVALDAAHADACTTNLSWAAFIFFPFCFILLNFFFLNLFTSIVLESFYEMPSYGVGAITITDRDLDNFKVIWGLFDRYGEQRISVYDLPRFLRAVPPPLSIGVGVEETMQYFLQRANRRGSVIMGQNAGDPGDVGADGMGVTSAVEDVLDDELGLCAFIDDSSFRSKQVQRIIQTLDLPVESRYARPIGLETAAQPAAYGTIGFQTTLRAVLRRLVGIALPSELESIKVLRRDYCTHAIYRPKGDIVNDSLLKQHKHHRGEGGTHATPLLASLYYTPVEFYAAVRLQRKYWMQRNRDVMNIEKRIEKASNRVFAMLADQLEAKSRRVADRLKASNRLSRLCSFPHASASRRRSMLGGSIFGMAQLAVVQANKARRAVIRKRKK
jgi:hypothetical protein